MIDIHTLFKKPDFYKKAASSKGADPSIVDEIISHEKKRKDFILRIEKLRR